MKAAPESRATESKTSEHVTAGLARRGLALVLDATPAAFVVALSFAFGWLDARILQPPHGWFWSEWLFKFWLDERAALILPVALFLGLAIAWTTAWEALRGRSPGGQVAGVLVVDRDAFTVSATRAILRGVGAGLNVASLGLGYLWIFVSSYRRGWHDYLAGTLVIRDDE
ncbi:RDD family protein [Persicimonas caeni]|uniref:RDD family protein n=1 Tax=Persicimonas caeni TaxID=2292766 RepID=A0A4Y6Q182_PERCE|nr:RDD family protein [Persicimonas caeni]QDG54272.1 RDD family protein [Persicimonas caeni]QED35493.1 RDD family protein [Persicimonas caeni]